MKLSNVWPQVTVIESDQDHAVLSLFVSEDIDYFKGHFPGTPILAGVVQLDWAIHYGKQYLTLDSHPVKNVEALKYQVVIPENSTLQLELTKKSAQKFTFKYLSEAGTHASGRIVLEG